MKIENDEEYHLFAVLAHALCFKKDLIPELNEQAINTLTDAIDAYDELQGWVMDEPTQEAIDEHKRDMTNAS